MTFLDLLSKKKHVLMYCTHKIYMYYMYEYCAPNFLHLILLLPGARKGGKKRKHGNPGVAPKISN